jgi:hypothetical protein
MLRLLVLLLALANVAFFVWTLGWLDDIVGVRARGDREPERLVRQVRPESIRILPPGPPKSGGAGVSGASAAPGAEPGGLIAAAGPAAGSEAGSAPSCLEAGPFNAAQAGAAEALLQASLPAGSWNHLKTERPALWMVYIGRFADAESMTRRQDELRRIRVEYEILRAPSELAPGLSLGRFEVRANANNLLDQLQQRGVNSARVIEAVPASSSHVLRVDKPTPALSAQLAALRAEALGKGFMPCAKP